MLNECVVFPFCSVGPAEAEAVRSAANLVVAHVLRSQLLGFALANFLLSMYALWACITKVGSMFSF